MDLTGTTVLLLERCEPGTPLSDVTEADQAGVVAGLLHRLWIQPPQVTASGHWRRCASSGPASLSRKPRPVMYL